MADQPSADPQDAKFGRDAARKAEILDEAVEHGKTPEELDAEDEDRRRRSGSEAVEEGRPGGKAEPSKTGSAEASRRGVAPWSA